MEVYTDAAKGEEVVGLAWYIVLEGGRSVNDSRYMDGNYTSMEAEYFALLDGLRFAKRHDTEYVEAYSDCKPLIEKMQEPDEFNQDWRQMRAGALRLLNKFDTWHLEWTPRSTNTNADRLAYEALEEGRST